MNIFINRLKLNKQKPSIALARRESGNSTLVLVSAMTLFFMVGFTFFLNSWSSSATEMPQSAVEISSTSFIPTTIRVKVGSQITWINTDTAPHQITSQQLIGPKAPEPMAEGESYSYIFETKGSYNYYDLLGTDVLQGVVVVE